MRGRLVLLAVLVAVGLGLIPGRSRAMGFDGDELECEEAVARLEQCCDGVSASIDCVDHRSGCLADEDGAPNISGPQSECLRALTCAEIRERGICAAIVDPARRATACSK